VVYPLVNIWGSNNLLLWLSPSRSCLDVLTPTCRSSSGTRYQYACTSDFGECSSICNVKGLGARSATLSTSHCLAVARQSLNHHNGCDGRAGPVHTKCTCRAERLQTSRLSQGFPYCSRPQYRAFSGNPKGFSRRFTSNGMASERWQWGQHPVMLPPPSISPMHERQHACMVWPIGAKLDNGGCHAFVD
jgi:hypothetical protein